MKESLTMSRNYVNNLVCTLKWVLLALSYVWANSKTFIHDVLERCKEIINFVILMTSFITFCL